MLGILPLLLLAGYPAKISFPPGVYPVPKLVRMVSDASGLALRAGREVESEVVFVSLPPSDPEGLIRLIAKADSAEWVEENGTRTLTRSVGLRLRQEREDAAQLAAMYRRVLSPYVWPDNKQPVADDAELAPLFVPISSRRIAPRTDEKLQAQIAHRSPCKRLLSRIAEKLDLSAVSKLEIGRNMYLSNRPRKLQTMLPDPGGKSLAAYVSDRNLFTAKIGELAEPEQIPLMRLLGVGYFSDFKADERDRLATISENPYVLVNIERRSAARAFLELKVYSADGRKIFDADQISVRLYPEFEPKAFPNFNEWKDRDIWPKAGPAALSFWAGLRDEPGDPAEIAKLASATANEPVAALMEDVLRQIAEGMGRPLIARIPDEAAGGFAQGLLEIRRAEGVARVLSECVALTDEDGVLIGRSRRPSESRAIKWDRKQATRLLSKYADGRVAMLDEIAPLVDAEGDGPAQTGLEYSCLQGLGLHRIPIAPIDAFDAVSDRESYYFYNRLTPAQKEDALHGRSIRIAALTPSARRVLESIVLLSNLPATPSGIGSKVSVASSYVDALPSGGVIECSSHPDLYACAIDKDGMWRARAMDQLAQLFEDAKNGDDESAGEIPKQGWILCSATSLRFEVRLSEHLYSMGASVLDCRFDARTKPVTLEHFPPLYRKAFDRELAKIRKTQKPNG